MPRNSSLSHVLFSIAGAAAVSFSPLLAEGSAQALPAMSTTSPNFGSNAPFTLGYSFTVNSPITVTHLGAYDVGADGLAEAHTVGLWNAAGTLLASTSVPNGTTAALDANNQFRIVPIANLNLSVGTQYVVGAVFPTGNDLWAFAAQRTTAPQITFVDGRFTSGASLAFPGSTDTNAYLGGSFEFTPTPVPFAFNPLFGVGVLGLSQARRALKRRNEKQPSTRADA